VSSTGADADAARREFREMIDRPGHAVDNARAALAGLEEAFARSQLQRAADLEQAISDLELALSQPAGQKLGGKSAEAARFIGRHIARLLDDA
jgi:phage shock protein A